MIKALKVLALLLVIGLLIVFGPQASGTQGVVFISFGNWTMEGSVWQFLGTITIVVLLLWLTIQLLKLGFKTLILPSTWWSSRQLSNQSNFLQSGIDFMALGQWQLADNQFKKVKRKERIETAQQLQLVCAAHKTQDAKLALPEPEKSNASTSALFARLSELKKQRNYGEALALLKEQKGPMHKQAVPMQQLCLEIQILAGDWNSVIGHLPKLDKLIGKYSDDEGKQAWLTHMEAVLITGFDHQVQKSSVNQLQQLWQSWTKAIKGHVAVLNAYLEVLAKYNQHQLIETEVLQHIKAQSDSWLLELIRHVYAHSGTVPMAQLFAKVQQKASKQPDNKSLITAMAYLAAGHKDHQLAKQALEQVIYTNQNQWDTRLYACTLAELGELRHSVDVFKSISTG